MQEFFRKVLDPPAPERSPTDPPSSGTDSAPRPGEPSAQPIPRADQALAFIKRLLDPDPSVEKPSPGPRADDEPVATVPQARDEPVAPSTLALRVPRTPEIAVPPHTWVFESPTFRLHEEDPGRYARPHAYRGAEPRFRSGPKGFFWIGDLGLVFTPAGTHEEWLRRLAQRAHDPGVFDAWVPSAMGFFREWRTHDPVLDHPHTMIIPAPTIVGLYHEFRTGQVRAGLSSRSELRAFIVVTTEDDAGGHDHYCISPDVELSDGQAAEVIQVIWAMRFTYELRSLVVQQLSERLAKPDQAELIPRYLRATYRKDASLDACIEQIDAALADQGVSHEDLQLEAFRHLQHFRRVPVIDRRCATYWQRIEAEHQPTCPSCNARQPATARFCGACGSPLVGETAGEGAGYE